MSNKMKLWLRAAAIRAIKTMAQTAAAINAVDWETVLGTAALAGAASVLTSLAGLPEIKDVRQTY